MCNTFPKIHKLWTGYVPGKYKQIKKLSKEYKLYNIRNKYVCKIRNTHDALRLLQVARIPL